MSAGGRQTGLEERVTGGVHFEVISTPVGAGAVNIFVICLDRKGGEHNIIDKPFGTELARAIVQADRLAGRGLVDVVVVCSAKRGSFMAGADIKHELQMIGEEGGARAISDCTNYELILAYLMALPVPTVAMVNGTALGGGMEVMLSTDYRIADSEHCQQIGLPEVKLGVLAVVGCVWLPRLIGFSHSLPLLLTGSSITAKKALSLGIVDLLLTETRTIPMTTGGQGSQQVYKYEYCWLPGLVRCIEEGRVGKRRLEVGRREEVESVECDMVGGGALEKVVGDTEEAKEEVWRRYEEKFVKRFPQRSSISSHLHYYGDLLTYAGALFQLWRRVGRRMPSPYVTLHSTLRCLYPGHHEKPMALSTNNMAKIIVTAESKCIMGLFLALRALKKYATHYGLQGRKKRPTFDKEKMMVVVVLSEDGLQFGSALIQGLLYAGVSVRGVGVRGEEVRGKVEGLFDYAVRRGHMKEEEVRARMQCLTVSQRWEEVERVDGGEGEGEREVVLINASLATDATILNQVMESIQKSCSKVVVMDTTPGGHIAPDHTHSTVLVNMGDPVRKNSLCVEISAASAKVPPDHIGTAANVIGVMGKTPVLTPSSPALCGSVAHYITLHHWSLAARLLTKGLSTAEVDSYAVRAGFTKGPFTAMKQLDTAYLRRMVDRCEQLTIPATDLQAYLEHNKTTPPAHKGAKPAASDVGALFLSTALKAALHARHIVCGGAGGRGRELPEYAIDVLCVSGLVSFPPTEGGPLNYLARNGAESILQWLDEVSLKEALREEVEGLEMRNILAQAVGLFEVTPRRMGKGKEEEKEREEEAVEDRKKKEEKKEEEEEEGEEEEGEEEERDYSSLVSPLSAAQLQIIGPTKGLTDLRPLLSPLWALLRVLTCALLALVVLCCSLLGYEWAGHPLTLGLLAIGLLLCVRTDL